MPTVPTGVLTIDYGNSLASGLVGVYVPGGVNGGSNLVDPGNGDVALYGTAVSGVTGNEGLGMQALGGGMKGTASAAQTVFTAASLYWRGDNIADGDGFSNLFGPDAKADYAAPWRDGFNIRTQTFASDGFKCLWNNGSSVPEVTNGGGLAAGVTGSVAASLLVSGNVNTYRDGAFVSSLAYGSAVQPVFDATARMQIGGTDNFGRYSNTLTYVGFMWNRVLDATEMATLDANPYAFLISPSTTKFSAFSIPQLDGRTITTMIGY